MRPHSIAACLIMASCLVSPCSADDEAANVRPMPLEPLTRARASQVLADTDTLAEDLTRQIKNLRNPAEAAVIDDLHDVLTHSSEWEWYSRDHGILLAIPVKERLGILAGYKGEKVLADVVRRLINQKGWGNPPVQVVLIEPALPMIPRYPAVEQSAFFPAATFGDCNCR
jgi:hypothetical protein